MTSPILIYLVYELNVYNLLAKHLHKHLVCILRVVLAMSHGFHPDTPALLFLDGVLRDDASMPLCSVTTHGPPTALVPLQRIATASKDACAYVGTETSRSVATHPGDTLATRLRVGTFLCMEKRRAVGSWFSGSDSQH